MTYTALRVEVDLIVLLSGARRAACLSKLMTILFRTEACGKPLLPWLAIPFFRKILVTALDPLPKIV